MIPAPVAELIESLPEDEVAERLIRDGDRRYLELGPEDEDLRLRLGVETDRLGPERVVILWDEADQASAHDLPVGGYLIVDNVAMGRPSLGGIRLAPDVTPNMIASLARGMTLKNAAADIPFGGGKAGIVADQGLPPEVKRQTVVRFARLIARYRGEYNPGPDVGVNDEDLALVAMENGLDSAVSKPARMGGTEIDKCGATAAGLVVALETILASADALAELPQFASLAGFAGRPVTVMVQGFGAVGANVALFLHNRGNGRAEGHNYRVVGVSDAYGFLFSEGGLDIPELYRMARDDKAASHKLYLRMLESGSAQALGGVKFSNSRDDLLRESADVLVPAAPVANYIGLDMASDPSMILDRIGRWHVIIEGANTLSTAAEKRAERRSIERILYRERGTFVATDYLSNSGGVIFAGHEKLVPTPADLRFPGRILGDHDACERWLGDHADQFAQLADERRSLAQARRDQVIEQNMRLLIADLVDDPSLLPCDVAEAIAKGRIESQRTIERLMVRDFVAVSPDETLGTIAGRLKDVPSDAALVLSPDGALVGIITDWDIVLAIANQLGTESPAREIMTRDVVAFGPRESVLDVMPVARKHGYSVMPVVDEDGGVLGVIRLQDLIEI